MGAIHWDFVAMAVNCNVETNKTNNSLDGKYPKKGFCVSTRRLFKYYKIAELLVLVL